MEYQMVTKIVSKIQKDKRPKVTSVFKLFFFVYGKMAMARTGEPVALSQ